MANTRCISYVRHKSGRNPFPVFCNVTEYYIQRDNDILSYHAHGPGYKTEEREPMYKTVEREPCYKTEEWELWTRSSIV